jgi:glycosyltransferase involved in cell wall biosynthesis
MVMTSVNVSVIIPIHNEEGTLRELHQRITGVFNLLPHINKYEIIFVDDCSNDGSNTVLNEIQGIDKKCIIYEHDKRMGQTGAFKTGFDNARYEVCITMDGDLQVFPEDIPRLLEHMNCCDLVNARRRMRKDKFITILSSMFYNLLTKVIFKSPASDSASNFTVVRTHYVKNLNMQKNDHRYIVPIVIGRGGIIFKEIDVDHFPRQYGKSKYSLFKAWQGIFELFEFKRRLRNGLYR